jgi:IS30 family transposase
MTKYNQIGLEEREKIYQLIKAGKDYKIIAEELGRHRSTIYREIKRNSSLKLGYLPDRASNLALGRKNRLLSKIKKYPELKQYIVDRLSLDKWSPEMIAGRIRLEKKEIAISHETIYQYIYSYPGQKQKLYQHLMLARPKRQLKYSRRKRIIADQYKIANRPEYINNRSEFGHFEADLTFFKGSKNGNFTVLVERVSRKAFLMLNNNKTCNNVMLGLMNKAKTISTDTIKSITFDNGGEFKRFQLLALNGINTYFCDPGAPYQKGQVERTNAILHKFIPKNTDFRTISNDNVISANQKLNNLPRKCLNYLTPNEAWDNYQILNRCT